ncbi:hypothetical protein Q3G72_013852 [Acer saccharum]|nr:hypothetical protein Q3G72_013852 [Acer saccharum]
MGRARVPQSLSGEEAMRQWKSKLGKDANIEKQAASTHSFTGSSNPARSKEPKRRHNMANEEEALDNEIPRRRMTIRRHLGTDKMLEEPHDVMVKDIEKLKQDMERMKMRSRSALARRTEIMRLQIYYRVRRNSQWRRAESRKNENLRAVKGGYCEQCYPLFSF